MISNIIDPYMNHVLPMSVHCLTRLVISLPTTSPSSDVWRHNYDKYYSMPWSGTAIPAIVINMALDMWIVSVANLSATFTVDLTSTFTSFRERNFNSLEK